MSNVVTQAINHADACEGSPGYRLQITLKSGDVILGAVISNYEAAEATRDTPANAGSVKLENDGGDITFVAHSEIAAVRIVW